MWLPGHPWMPPKSKGYLFTGDAPKPGWGPASTELPGQLLHPGSPRSVDGTHTAWGGCIK